MHGAEGGLEEASSPEHCLSYSYASDSLVDTRIALCAGILLASHPKTSVVTRVIHKPVVLKAKRSSAPSPSITLPKNCDAIMLSGHESSGPGNSFAMLLVLTGPGS